MKRNFWLQLFLVCVGILVGTLAASLTADIPFLAWLSYGMSFGIPDPAVIDLQVLTITFGISVNICISVILFVVLALILGHHLSKK